MKHRSLSASPRGGAFTLIELLVVIAIIAILAAILFPVFAQAKLAAKKSAGLAQMKQIGTALMMYSSDYDDGLPTWDSYYTVYPTSLRDPVWMAGGSPPSWKRMWDALLIPYVKHGNFHLQTALANVEFAGIWKSPGAEYEPRRGRSIGMNQLLFWDVQNTNDPTQPLDGPNVGAFTGVYKWINHVLIEKPAETMFVGDTGTGGRYEPIFFLNGYQETYLTFPSVPAWSTPWRYGKHIANYVWLDGHASAMPGNKAYPNPGPGRAFATWSTADLGQTYCAAARTQATTQSMRDYVASFAIARGVPCVP